MAIKTSAELKAYFNTGDVPTESQYINLIDTIMNGLASKPLVYKALISQSGTSAPTVVILENTIGAIVWTRTNIGEYFGTLANAFTLDKTFIPPMRRFLNGDLSGEIIANAGRISVNQVKILTFDSGYTEQDDALDSNTILIEVYP